MHLNSFKKLLVLQIALIVFGLLLNEQLSFGQSQEHIQKMELVTQTSVIGYQEQIDKLLNLMQQRLVIQYDVAQWKWNHNSAIEAPEREQALLADIRNQASAYNLDSDVATIFFQWQLFAGKLIQVNEFQTWQRQRIQSFEHVPDLNHTLRPSLDRLSPEILAALAPLSPLLSCSTVQHFIQSRAQMILRGNGINDTVRRIAIAPLIERKGNSCQDIPGLDGVKH